MSRRTVALLVLVVLILVALLGFYLFLTGGSTFDRDRGTRPVRGLIHVRSIYVADGENLSRPTGLGATEDGHFYVTLKDTARVIGFDRDGDPLVRWGERGLLPGQLLAPVAVAADAASRSVYVIDRARLRLICYDTNGRFQWEQPVGYPVGVVLISDGVLVTTAGPIQWFTREGQPVATIGSRGYAPGSFDHARAGVQLADGDVVIADTNNTRVQRIELTSETTTTIEWILGTPPRHQDDTRTLFAVPAGITRDSRGRVYVLDGFRHKIDVLDPATGRIIHTFAGLDGQVDGRFNLPTGIAYLGGDTFAVTDTYNDRVQIIRLLLPDEDTVIRRYRWLAFLPLLLLPLLLLLRPKRVFVTREALEAALEQGRARLLVGAFKRLYVLPEVARDLGERVEEGFKIGEYMTEVSLPVATGVAVSEGDEEQRLARAIRDAKRRSAGLLRTTLVCLDRDQCSRMRALVRVGVRDWPALLEEYELAGEAGHDRD